MLRGQRASADLLSRFKGSRIAEERFAGACGATLGIDRRKIPNAPDMLTVFVGLYVLVSIARLGLQLLAFRRSEQRAHASIQRGEKRILEHQAAAEEYQRRNRELQERAEAQSVRNEEVHVRYEALQDRREALQLRQEANAERVSAVLAKLEDLLPAIERKVG